MQLKRINCVALLDNKLLWRKECVLLFRYAQGNSIEKSGSELKRNDKTVYNNDVSFYTILLHKTLMLFTVDVVVA